MSSRTYIVWDLGATKCAAAVVTVTHGVFEVQNTHSVKLKKCESLFHMAETLHRSLGVCPHDVDGVCVAGAGQYDGQELILASSYPFPMCFAKVASLQKWPEYQIVHDYTPIVCSTFVSQHNKGNIIALNDAEVQPGARRVAFGVGPGLGG